ncbi:MAG: EAL domain-containing protein [Thiogranum sp.]|nr:EAL domain-containing protein [Thiogranum sp.]
MSPPETVCPSIQSGLPLKIAGIVFWGLMATGIIIASSAMRLLEREMLDNYQSNAGQAVSSIQAILNVSPDANAEVLSRQIDEVIKKLEIRAVTIERGLETITVGSIDGHLSVYAAALPYAENQSETGASLIVTIYEPPLSEILKEQKKNLMLGMGLAFFTFGVLLQSILQRILTGPFLSMVSTARKCSHGEEVVFDETRQDEFGYLSSFINKALASLNERRRELSLALDRAMLSEHALFEEKERAEVTLNSIAEGVITIDQKGNIRFMNPVAEGLSGWSQQCATGKHINEIVILIDDRTADHIESLALACLRSNKIERSLESRLLIGLSGAEIAVEESAAPMHNLSGETVGAVLVLEDVRQKKLLTEQLSYQASHDPLTGLFNRNEFERRVQLALEGTPNDRDESALCYMDLDQFKVVNDTCGHIAGDELLCQLGRLLLEKIRDSDTVARLGGDEFGILLSGCSIHHAERLAAELRKAIHDFDFWWEGKSFNVGASIGLVPLSQSTQSVTEALAAADVACYAAKEHGRGQVHVYEPDDKDLNRRRSDMEWVGKIRRALKEDRFQLYLQPIVPVSSVGNRHYHAEILLRMLDEEGTVIAPGCFLGAAEQYGLMPLIDEWVLGNTFEWLGSDSGRQPTDSLISVNLSGQSMSSRAFLPKVVELLHASGVAPQQICFEITETAAVANFEVALEFIRFLKGMGCQFAIDDFGNGMSSFTYLKQLPVDYLKIDGSYVKDMLNDPIDRALVEAVNQIGHAMGMQTIAEFVEDDATFRALAKVGVDFAQGFGIGEPRPIGLAIHQGDQSSAGLLSPASRSG